MLCSSSLQLFRLPKLVQQLVQRREKDRDTGVYIVLEPAHLACDPPVIFASG